MMTTTAAAGVKRCYKRCSLVLVDTAGSRRGANEAVFQPAECQPSGREVMRQLNDAIQRCELAAHVDQPAALDDDINTHLRSRIAIVSARLIALFSLRCRLFAIQIAPSLNCKKWRIHYIISCLQIQKVGENLNPIKFSFEIIFLHLDVVSIH